MPTKAQWGTILFSLVYFALALACLREWGASRPWARVDVFSGGFLGLLILSVAYELLLGLPTLRSSAALREASGMTYDRATLMVLTVLSAGDFLVFLDYSHRHLIPTLPGTVLQSAGLLLAVIAVVWVAWTDTHLARHFAHGPGARRVLRDGPFRYVRHPRYAGILGVRLAFALVFASPAGWVLAIAWTIVLLRRIRLEERYLQQQFGREYETYAKRTPRLVPGVF